MAITSYTDLQTTIASYLARTDLNTMIPTFIDFAEGRLARDLRTRPMLRNVTSSMPASQAKIALPNDFLAVRDVFIQGNPREAVTYLTPSAFTRDGRADQSGKPLYYTVYGTEFVFSPIPDAEYTLELLYYARPNRLDADTISNVFLANYPDALLYASLIEAEPYLMNDARTSVWGTLYDKAIAAITRSDDEGEFSAVPMAIKIVR